MRKLILIVTILFVFWPTSAYAWGPIAHEEIGVKMSPWITVDQVAFQAGVVMPDVSLARYEGKLYTEQVMFHAPVYLTNLKVLANTPELKDFVKGYQSHLTSDLVQESYDKGKPLSADFAVDAIIGLSSVRSITVSNAEVDLLIAAWNLTYPDYPWKPDQEWIMVAPIAFQIYFNGLGNSGYTQADHDAGLAVFPDYQTYLTLSAKNSLDVLVLRGDANRDGKVNMGDVVMVERIILGLAPKNAEADANGDWQVDMGDVVKIERILLGLWRYGL